MPMQEKYTIKKTKIMAYITNTKFTFTIKTADGIGKREIEAYNIEECISKLGWDNAEIGFIPHMKRIKYINLEWNITVPSYHEGHSSRYHVSINKDLIPSPITNTTFKKATLRLERSSRGGGIEIDLGILGHKQGKMTAYQNHLGGGMLGSIGSSWNGKGDMDEELLKNIEQQLKKYYHSLTDSQVSFQDIQRRSLSAY
jgi:hypothetical protein